MPTSDMRLAMANCDVSETMTEVIVAEVAAVARRWHHDRRPDPDLEASIGLARASIVVSLAS